MYCFKTSFSSNENCLGAYPVEDLHCPPENYYYDGFFCDVASPSLLTTVLCGRLLHYWNDTLLHYCQPQRSRLCLARQFRLSLRRVDCKYIADVVVQWPCKSRRFPSGSTPVQQRDALVTPDRELAILPAASCRPAKRREQSVGATIHHRKRV